MKAKVQNVLAWFLASFFFVLADRATKIWAVSSLKGKGPLVIIPGVFELLYSENRGAAFGMFQGGQVVFSVVGIAVIVFSFVVICRLPGFDRPRYTPLKLCASLFAAGAFGNLIDRIARGYVVDFLYFCLINFPIFNVADICVTSAAFFLIVLLFFYYSDEDLSILSFGSRKKGGPAS